MQNFNLHTHTYRCGHAIEDENKYIEFAIRGGFNHIGFSEHIGHKGWDDKNIRMDYDEMEQYFQDIKSAKEKYKDKINVYLGLEFEYFDDNDEYYDYVRNICDYMIIGEHFVEKFGVDLYLDAPDEAIDEYARLICQAIEKGYSKYIAHPSYFMISCEKFDEKRAQAIEKIANCAKKNDAALEWNLKGMGYGMRKYQGYESYIYPHLKAFEIIREINPYIVIGYDAHDPKVLESKELEMKARRILDGANIIEDVSFFMFQK